MGRSDIDTDTDAETSGGDARHEQVDYYADDVVRFTHRLDADLDDRLDRLVEESDRFDHRVNAVNFVLDQAAEDVLGTE